MQSLIFVAAGIAIDSNQLLKDLKGIGDMR